ncbi:hypothetical protein ACFSRY_06930, partial [Pontibacter locisalis]
DEAWQENKQGLLQPDLEEDIPHLSAKSSLSGKVKIRKIQLKSLTFKTVPYPSLSVERLVRFRCRKALRPQG